MKGLADPVIALRRPTGGGGRKKELVICTVIFYKSGSKNGSKSRQRGALYVFLARKALEAEAISAAGSADDVGKEGRLIPGFVCSFMGFEAHNK